MDETGNSVQNLISGNAEKTIEQLVNNSTSITTNKQWTSIFFDFYDKFVKPNKLLFIWITFISLYLIYRFNKVNDVEYKKKHKHHKHKKKHHIISDDDGSQKKNQEEPFNDLGSLENLTAELNQPDEIQDLNDEVNDLRLESPLKKSSNFKKVCGKIFNVD